MKKIFFSFFVLVASQCVIANASEAISSLPRWDIAERGSYIKMSSRNCVSNIRDLVFLDSRLRGNDKRLLAMTAGQIPDGLKNRLLSHPWNGFITDGESVGNSQTHILLNFTLDEHKELTGTITLFSYDVGNGRYNFTRFVDISYDHFKQSLLLSFWPPVTPVDTAVWILESTLIDNQFISGLYLERPSPSEPDHKRKKGTFRIQ